MALTLVQIVIERSEAINKVLTAYGAKIVGANSDMVLVERYLRFSRISLDSQSPYADDTNARFIKGLYLTYIQRINPDALIIVDPSTLEQLLLFITLSNPTVGEVYAFLQKLE